MDASRPALWPTRCTRSLRAGLLLLRCVGPRSGDGLAASRRLTKEETAYDLYEPAGTPRKTFILVYGMTLAGEKDARLTKVAQAFVKSGFRVAIPSLPGLKSLALEQGDLAAIGDLVTELHGQDGGKIGVGAFSAGAGMALTVAAQPAVAEMIDPLLLFGPYYRLSDLWARWPTQGKPASDRNKDWDCFIWTQMVSAFRNLASLDLEAGERQELVDLLRDYCTEPSLKRKRQFYQRVLRGRRLRGLADPPPDEHTLERLSPCGRMDGVRGRVLILHDPADYLIPVWHSEQIMAELRQRGMSDAQRLVATPLLSHVGLNLTWRILDVFRIVKLVGEIFAE